MGEQVFGKLSLLIINAFKQKFLVKNKLVEEAFLLEKFLGGESKKKDFFFV